MQQHITNLILEIVLDPNIDEQTDAELLKRVTDITTKIINLMEYHKK